MTKPSITVEYLDPSSLLIDVNIRSEATLDKDFLVSIRDLGVLVPIVAVRTADGAVRVRHGHRRTLAAVETGLASVPVVTVGEDDADEVGRIVSQWHENEYRAGLSTADKLAAVEQLSLLGLSPTQIVKRTKARKTDVEQALAAARSDLAKGAAGRWEFLTLDQAAAVAEFESSPATVKTLVAAAKQSDGDYRHALQRARDEREDAQQSSALIEQLTTAGVRIIDQPGYNQRTIKALTELVTAEGKQITHERHASCPGHAAYVGRTWRGIEAVYVCTEWAANGHRDRYDQGGRPANTPMNEQAKAERKAVLAHNRDWRSAEAVRREWVSALLSRKTQPKGAAVYLAGELARGPHQLTKALDHANPLAATLLGADADHSRQSVAALAEQASEVRAQVIALGVVLAAVEDSTGVQSWRNPNDTVKRYFAFLAANGYVLSEVEKIAAGTTKKPRRSARGAKPAEAVEADRSDSESAA
jgi:ParB family chromosome partitioning protein